MLAVFCATMLVAFTRIGYRPIGWVHSAVAAINPGRWPQAFVAELRSQIETENQQRPDQAIGWQYNRHFYIIYRGGRYARVSWRDDTTYEVSTAKMEAGNLQWLITDSWRLATDEQRIISGSSGRTWSHTEAVRNFLMLLEA